MCHVFWISWNLFLGKTVKFLCQNERQILHNLWSGKLYTLFLMTLLFLPTNVDWNSLCLLLVFQTSFCLWEPSLLSLWLRSSVYESKCERGLERQYEHSIFQFFPQIATVAGLEWGWSWELIQVTHVGGMGPAPPPAVTCFISGCV